MTVGIFIFHRDLRINDNKGLIALQELTTKIIPVFIFDKYQLKNKYNKNYFSQPACNER